MDVNEIVKKAVRKFPDKAREYRAGNKGLLSLFVGEAMIMSKCLAHPKYLLELVKMELACVAV